MLRPHDDIFLADIMGYDRLEFTSIYALKIKSWARHWYIAFTRSPFPSEFSVQTHTHIRVCWAAALASWVQYAATSAAA